MMCISYKYMQLQLADFMDIPWFSSGMNIYEHVVCSLPSLFAVSV